MDFKTNKIRKEIPRKKITKEQRKKITISFGVVSLLTILLLLTIGIVEAVKSIDVGVILKAAGTKLQTDAYNHTNFLVLGTGGENHDGGDLTDTMIVASLDQNNDLITMVSLPRDTWVTDDTIGSFKINEVYYHAQNYFGTSEEGLEHLKTEVEEIMGIPIHYWVKIDFKGFKDLVDALGGIDIYVEEEIYDPYYPKDGTYGFEPFHITVGEHHIDGETALKYARSRKTTSDFDRANRQQEIIYAIKEKALQTEIIFSKEKISNILEAISSNIETNISIKEILTLGSIAKDLQADQISHRLIHDDPNQCGGFLYTPERKYYNNLFVLIPAGGFEYIHLYSDLNFNHPQVNRENAKLQILNGTKTPGVAGETKQVLQRYCLNVVRYGNARETNLPETTYYYKQKFDENGKPIDSRPVTLDFLQTIIPGKESTEIPQSYKELGYDLEADIIIELGSDYVESPNYLEDPFYYLPWPTTTPTSTETETTDSAAESASEISTETPAEPETTLQF